MEIQIRQTVAHLLRRTLSPTTFEFARIWWWRFSFPARRVFSRFVKRKPEVRGFGSGDGASHFVQQLQNVNVLAPTEMCRVMTKYGSDKAKRHNFTTVYSVLFKAFRNQPARIFELGLGTNNPGLPSSMGIYGRPGASLRGWQELFPNALVYGADIDRSILFQDDRIKTFYCDQLDPASIRELWSQPDLQNGLDVIIEDGLHTFEANVSFLEGSLEHLRPGGVYVVEDIDQSMVDRWCDQLETIYSKRYPTFLFAVVILPSSLKLPDNNLLVVYRGTESSVSRSLRASPAAAIQINERQ